MTPIPPGCTIDSMRDHDGVWKHACKDRNVLSALRHVCPGIHAFIRGWRRVGREGKRWSHLGRQIKFYLTQDKNSRQEIFLPPTLNKCNNFSWEDTYNLLPILPRPWFSKDRNNNKGPQSPDPSSQLLWAADLNTEAFAILFWDSSVVLWLVAVILLVGNQAHHFSWGKVPWGTLTYYIQPKPLSSTCRPTPCIQMNITWVPALSWRLGL